MSSSTALFINVLLPGIVAILIFGLGLSLGTEDFLRVLKEPRAAAIGLIAKIVFSPLVAFLLARAFQLDAALSIGMMILASAPGSVLASVFSRLGGGDVALSLTLTAIDSVIAAFFLPVVIVLSVKFFLGADQPLSLLSGELLKMLLILLLPVAAGMAVRSRKPHLARVLELRLRTVSIVILVLLVSGAILKERALLLEHLASLGSVVVAFNLACILLGVAVGKVFRVPAPQVVSIAVNMGIQGTAFAIAVATSLFGDTTYAMPAAIFSLTMYVLTGAFVFVFKRAAR